MRPLQGFVLDQSYHVAHRGASAPVDGNRWYSARAEVAFRGDETRLRGGGWATMVGMQPNLNTPLPGWPMNDNPYQAPESPPVRSSHCVGSGAVRLSFWVVVTVALVRLVDVPYALLVAMALSVFWWIGSRWFTRRAESDT
jgi:hypothetical protein